MHDSFTKQNKDGYKFKYIEMIRYKYKMILKYLNNDLFGDLDDKLNDNPFMGMNPSLYNSQSDKKLEL